MVLALVTLVLPAAAAPWVPDTCPADDQELIAERDRQLAECKEEVDKRTCMSENGWTKVKKAEVEAFSARCESDRAVAMAAADSWVVVLGERR